MKNFLWIVTIDDVVVLDSWFYIRSAVVDIIQIMVILAVVYDVIKRYRKIIKYLDRNS
ncbi:hypothetical protein [Flavobacterium sp.]|uniref:hypothetical protein n=1 Tax=Flavobacterium sp. TaxID=239 RepID=UPI002637BA5F|nr:hypothetical protein [Flavobacterium sp.]